MRRPTDECRALAALARRAYERLDALRRDSPVFMRDSAAGVERDRAVALAWRAPRPLDLPGVSDIERIPGLLYGCCTAAARMTMQASTASAGAVSARRISGTWYRSLHRRAACPPPAAPAHQAPSPGRAHTRFATPATATTA